MSRLDVVLDSPVTRYIQWKTRRNEDEVITGGAFTYWDKEKKENVWVELPFRFAILEENRVTFKGYWEKKKMGVWSNEVGRKEQEVNLKCSEGSLMKFKKKDYKDVKDQLKGYGAKYTQVVYVAVEVDGEYEIWGMCLNGAALTGGVDRDSKDPEEANDGWFRFLANHKKFKYSNFVEVTGHKTKKKGSTKFATPVMKLGDEIGIEDDDILKDLTKSLLEYLKFYDGQREETAKEEQPEEKPEEVYEDDDY